MQIDEDSLETRSCIPGLQEHQLGIQPSGRVHIFFRETELSLPSPLSPKYLQIQTLEGVSVKHPGSQMVTRQ